METENSTRAAAGIKPAAAPAAREPVARRLGAAALRDVGLNARGVRLRARARALARWSRAGAASARLAREPLPSRLPLARLRAAPAPAPRPLRAAPTSMPPLP